MKVQHVRHTIVSPTAWTLNPLTHDSAKSKIDNFQKSHTGENTNNNKKQIVK